MPRAARSIEILRVSAHLNGDEFNTSAGAARDAVVRWAASPKRSAGNLPKEAWDHRDFDLVAGGRNSAAIRISNHEFDLWALRAEDPDEAVAGRIWSTEVVIGGKVGKRPQISLRLIVSTNEHDFRVEPHVPGTILQMIDAPGLIRGARPLLSAPRMILSQNDAEDLCDHLEDTERRLPVVAVVVTDNASEAPIDIETLAKATAGIARVVRIPEAMTWVITNRLGRYRSVFNGGVRVYMAGFSASDDPYHHRLFLGDSLRDIGAANSCVNWLRSLAAETSIATKRLDKEVLEFASVRTASRRLKAKDQSARSAPDAELLQTAKELIDSLDRQIVERSHEIDGYVGLREAAEARALASEKENRSLLFLVKQLKAALGKGGETPTLEPPMPQTWWEFLDWFDNTYPEKVLMTPAARRMVKSPEFENVEQVSRLVSWLATTQHEIRTAGGVSLRDIPIENGIINSPCGGDTYRAEWRGRFYEVDWHMKSGGNSRDPKRCLRIYYFWEPELQQTVIDHLPTHRHTSAT